jgi:hypothetical protein
MDKARLRTTNLDAVVASVPVDRVAARVIFGGLSDQREIAPVMTTPERDLAFDRPYIVSLKKLKRMSTSSHAFARTIIGRNFGQLTVIGLADLRRSNNKAWWVVQCTCGRYDYRRATVINDREKNRHDACEACLRARLQSLPDRSA